MDLITYALCKGNGGGGNVVNPTAKGEMLVSALNDDDSLFWTSECLRDPAGWGLTTQDIYVSFDGETFSVDTYNSHLSTDDYRFSKSTSVHISVSGNEILETPGYYLSLNWNPIYQTLPIPLDTLGLTGQIGYLHIYETSENVWAVDLIYWQASTM